MDEAFDFQTWWHNTTEPERRREASAQLAAYWNEVGPISEGFSETATIIMAVFMCRRYEAALCRIAKQSRQWRKVAMEAMGLRAMEQVERMEALRRMPSGSSGGAVM
jgi:hypothetical protein